MPQMRKEKKYQIVPTMNIRTDHNEIWIALAKVKSVSSDNEIGISGYAYVTVVGLAKSKLGFRRGVAGELSRLNFKLLRLEDAEKFDDRVKKFKVDRIIHEIAGGLSGDERVKFSTFHTYS
jgi:hypothetical protein